ncbi:hypothetical protein [Endozoicomonas lisbonensis]|uniref:Uncharacterized protein n=1 Tax=Endozoicomonas lisbonensis TaxID=3120522 RepID=A0ABV2SPB5_9GAMM
MLPSQAINFLGVLQYSLLTSMLVVTLGYPRRTFFNKRFALVALAMGCLQAELTTGFIHKFFI